MNLSLSIFFDILLTTGLVAFYAKASVFLSPTTRLEQATQYALLNMVDKIRPFYFPLAVAVCGTMASLVLAADMLFAGGAILILGLWFNFRLYRLDRKTAIRQFDFQ